MTISRRAPRGERIAIAGYVLDDRCRPTLRSLVEIWQADENGEYDRRGFRLRDITSPTSRDAGGSTPSCRRCIRDARDTSISEFNDRAEMS